MLVISIFWRRQKDQKFKTILQKTLVRTVVRNFY